MSTTSDRAAATVTTPTTAAAAVGTDRRSRLRLIVVLGALIALGPLTIDTYLPALPALGADLDAGPTAVQLTLTGTLLGLGLGQLLLGPVSDAVGRRPPLLAGTALHVVASLACMVAPSIAVLGGLRVLQGVGAAAAAVVAMAVVRDLYTGSAAAALFSRLLLVMGVAPVAAPTLGGALLRWTDWRGVFAALAVLGLGLVLVAALGLPETLPPERRRPARAGSSLRAYGTLLRDRGYMGLVLVAGLAMGSIFAYVSGSSYVVQREYGLDEQQFGVVFGAGAIGMVVATQLNVRLLRSRQPHRIVTAALVGGSIAGVLLLTAAATGVGGLPGLLVPVWGVLAAAGLSLPNLPALALAEHGHVAGTASALLGAVQFGVAALAAPLVGALGAGALAMAAVVAGGMVLALVVLVVVVRPARLGAVDAVPAVAG